MSGSGPRALPGAADDADGRWSPAALAPYGLTPPLRVTPLAAGAGINNQVRVVQTGAERFLWKGYLTHADRARILAEHRLLDWLAGAGLPFGTPRPLATPDGDTLLPTPGGGWQALFRWLPGAPLMRRDPATIAALGAALGTLHGALVALPADLCPPLSPHGALGALHPRVSDPATLTPRDLGLPRAAPVGRALADLRALVAELAPFLAAPYRQLPWQAIHGDFGPGNALANGARIAALLDFEFAMRDARALDLAAGLGMTLRHWELAPAESLALGGAFCAGYARTGTLTAAEVAALPHLLLLREAVSAVWWLGRALAAGDLRPWSRRMADYRTFRAWLADHQAALLDSIGGAVALA